MNTEKTSGIVSFEDLMAGGEGVMEKLVFHAPGETTNDSEEKTNEEIVVIGESSLTEDKTSEEDVNKDEKVDDQINNLNREKQTDNLETVNSYSDVYRNQLKKLGIDSIVREENGEEVEKSIDELDIDEETFAETIQAYIAREKEEATKDKISVKGVSELAKQVIEIVKRGGNATEVLKLQEAYVDPLDKIDLSTAQGQKNALALYFTALKKDQDEINILIDSYEKRGDLEQRAQEADTKLREAVSSFAEQQKQAAIEAQAAKKEAEKKFRKEMKEQSASLFELKEAEINKVVDFATKIDDDGRHSLDKELTKLLNDPKETALLALFVLNRDEYNKQIANKAVAETRIKTAIKLGTVRSGEARLDSKETNGGSSKVTFIPIED